VTFQAEDRFYTDFHRLSRREQRLFMAAVCLSNEDYAGKGEEPLPHWPSSLRVNPVRGASGIFEMTWSFSGPDGRATFRLVEVEGEPAMRWRRIGGHDIFREP
jgi:hypothetical protein